MFRKTITIVSLIGLILSVGAWGMSCFYLSYTTQTHLIVIRYVAAWGGLEYTKHTPNWNDLRTPPLVGSWWTFRVPRDAKTRWVPSIGEDFLFIPLWIPSVLFSLVFAISYTPFHRRRKRKKLGLCVKCGYDLRGSKERCPECGREFEAPKPVTNG